MFNVVGGVASSSELASATASTAVSLAPYLEEEGLGYMDQQLVEATQEKIVQYLGMKEPQDLASLYTNQFAGKVKLTSEEWQRVYESVAEYRL